MVAPDDLGGPTRHAESVGAVATSGPSCSDPLSSQLALLPHGNKRTISGMTVRVEAHIRQRGTGERDEPARESRTIAVDADSFEDAKRLVVEQLPGDDWLVASWLVS